jgi:hypothetical protein
VDTYQQRRLEAVLIREGIASSWRAFLTEKKRLKVPAAMVVAQVVALGVTVDGRTLQRWTRQAEHQLSRRERQGVSKDPPAARVPDGPSLPGSRLTPHA